MDTAPKEPQQAPSKSVKENIIEKALDKKDGELSASKTKLISSENLFEKIKSNQALIPSTTQEVKINAIPSNIFTKIRSHFQRMVLIHLTTQLSDEIDNKVNNAMLKKNLMFKDELNTTLFAFESWKTELDKIVVQRSKELVDLSKCIDNQLKVINHRYNDMQEALDRDISTIHGCVKKYVEIDLVNFNEKLSSCKNANAVDVLVKNLSVSKSKMLQEIEAKLTGALTDFDEKVRSFDETQWNHTAYSNFLKSISPESVGRHSVARPRKDAVAVQVNPIALLNNFRDASVQGLREYSKIIDVSFEKFMVEVAAHQFDIALLKNVDDAIQVMRLGIKAEVSFKKLCETTTNLIIDSQNYTS